MRKNRFLNTVLSLLLSLAFCTNIYAQNKATKTDITKQYNWELVIEAIAKVESGKNPNAVSKSGKYVGYLQISPCIVDDCNEYLGYKKYTYSDRYSVEKSKEMFVLIQRRYNKSCSIEKAIRLWNGGCRYSVARTQGYYNKVMAHYTALK